MHVIEARNVNHALALGMQAIHDHGEPTPSRNGMTLEIPCPVTTIYKCPWERVLINKTRDANPFFHLFESLWILAGRKDVKFLTDFNSRMRDYSDNGKTFNAAYGYRLRIGVDTLNDQLKTVISILRHDPTSRQAVCQIWSDIDLDKTTKDKACNMSIVFRIRNNILDMIVYNRSNDMLWGCYGANAVQFSMIHEYVAAHLNLPMGTYTQVSNSFHVYTEGPGGDLYKNLESERSAFYVEPYKEYELGNTIHIDSNEAENFDMDLTNFFLVYDRVGIDALAAHMNWQTEYFTKLVMPMLRVYVTHKKRSEFNWLTWERMEKSVESIHADDWRMAALIWLENRWGV